MADMVKILQNMIRVGQVNSVKAEKGTVQVLFEDKDDAVSHDLPLLNFEYHMPEVGDQVICLFLANGIEQGFCLGSFHSDVAPPPADKAYIYKKMLDNDTYIEYNKQTKHLKVIVEEVNIHVNQGKVTVKADEILLGDGASEDVPLGNQLKQWLDNHTHPTPNGESGSPSSSSPSPSGVVKVK